MTLPSAEIAEWQAYERLEPFGQRRLDDGMRLLAAILVNANRGQHSPAVEPHEFLRAWSPVAAAETDEEAAVRALFAWGDTFGVKPVED